MKKTILIVLLFSFTLPLHLTGQVSLTYQKPSKEILDLADVSLAPSVLINDNKEFIVFLYRESFKSIEDLSKEELRLAGLRIDPNTNIGSRTNYYNNMKIKNIVDDSKLTQVKGLPENPKLSNFSFSPDQKKIAFTNTTDFGVEVWVLDLSRVSLKKLTCLCC